MKKKSDFKEKYESMLKLGYLPVGSNGIWSNGTNRLKITFRDTGRVEIEEERTFLEKQAAYEARQKEKENFKSLMREIEEDEIREKEIEELRKKKEKKK